MRISSLAREYDLSIQSVTAYLETIEPPLKTVHPNAKLDEETISKVLKHFDLEQQIETESIDVVDTSTKEVDEDPLQESTSEAVGIETHEEAVIESSITTAEEQSASSLVPESPEKRELDIKEQKDQSLSDSTEKTHSLEERESILSDKFIELLDSEEASDDLEKIKLIKAPKKKLHGLTVVDKIDLPTVTKKVESTKPESKSTNSSLSPEEKEKRVKAREAYKEKRRLEAKKKQEERETRKLARLKKEEKQRQKTQRTKHYQSQVVKKEIIAKTKKVDNLKDQPSTAKFKSTQTQKAPKTILGRFWRWLNT
ncbi:MAG: hypothetical protein AAF616_08665 [Bacteroidota bacterium]